MSKCVILTESMGRNLIMRYDGIGAPLSNDEKELLLFVLYTESEHRGGIVAEVRKLE